MRLTGKGQLGLGTKNPTEKLHVRGRVRMGHHNNGAGAYYTQDGKPGWFAGLTSDAKTFRIYYDGDRKDKFLIDTEGNAILKGTFSAKNMESKGTLKATEVEIETSLHAESITVDGTLTIKDRVEGDIRFLGTVHHHDAVVVGTQEDNKSLTVNGRVKLKDLYLDPTGNWADHVFEKGYALLPLSKLKEYVRKNRHLPEVPTAKEVAEKGVDMDAMQVTLLKKVEELTLYIMELKEEIELLKQ